MFLPVFLSPDLQRTTCIVFNINSVSIGLRLDEKKMKNRILMPKTPRTSDIKDF